MRPRRDVDLLIPPCSAASRKLKVVMCPLERVGPCCARLGCKVFNLEQGVAARAVPGSAGFYFVDHCSRPLPSVLSEGSTVVMQTWEHLPCRARSPCLATRAMRRPAPGGGQKATRLPPTRPSRWRRAPKPAYNGWTRPTTCSPRAAVFLFDHGYTSLDIRAYTSRSSGRQADEARPATAQWSASRFQVVAEARSRPRDWTIGSARTPPRPLPVDERAHRASRNGASGATGACFRPVARVPRAAPRRRCARLGSARSP